MQYFFETLLNQKQNWNKSSNCYYYYHMNMFEYFLNFNNYFFKYVKHVQACFYAKLKVVASSQESL